MRNPCKQHAVPVLGAFPPPSPGCDRHRMRHPPGQAFIPQQVRAINKISQVRIDKSASVIDLDGIAFHLNFSDASIESGNLDVLVFVYGAARAYVSNDDARKLILAGVKDNR